ncbi:MAG: UTP--glucose-1-phosphate uridylyltransferase [Deltaproteobacteria bacterium]|nr:UTP--glucose-1-phosphate uridylyltransferase [Deltaproteobacteria bacterium]
MSKSVKKAILPVAGLGTRLAPITRSIPKEMLPIVDKPMIQLAVEEALDAGVEQVILVSGRSKGSIGEYFNTNMGAICTVQQPSPLGLGHAVLCARPIIGDEPFAILLGDDLIFTSSDKPNGIRQLIDAYENTGKSQVAIQQVPRDEVYRYGAVEGYFSKDNKSQFVIESLVEKPPKGEEKTDQVIVGRYVLSPAVWPLLERQVANHQDDSEIQLTDTLIELLKSEGLMGLKFEGHRVDAGNRVGYLEANLVQALKRPELREDVLEILQKLDIA